MNISILLRKISDVFKKAILCSVAFFCIAPLALSQVNSGKIVGKVVDAQTGDPIISANVAITGTTQGAATDLDGRYSIQGVTPGIYSITVSYISHAKKTVTGIKVRSGQSTIQNILLQPKTIGLGEVTVTAQISSGSEAGLLSIQQKSTAVQNGLSSEYLSKTGDSNVASAIKRIPGVTLVNGNEVYVRGLGSRYSNIQLNGAQVPSTNPNKKEAPVDLFGSGLVESIIVQKTYTADQMAEFSGGSVKIITKEFPYEQSFSIGYSTSYNTVSTFENTLSSPGSLTDFLGYDNGKRSLPSVLKKRRVSDEMAPQIVRELHDDWYINNGKKAMPSQSVSVNYANQFNEDSMPIGVVGNFSYKYARKLQPNKRQRFVQFFNENGPDFTTNYTINKGIETAELSGMLNLFVKPSPVTKLGLKTLYSNAGSHSINVIQGAYQNGTTRQAVLNFERRSIFSATLEGETYFTDFMSSMLSGHLSYNRAARILPDRRTTRYNLVGDEFRFEDFGDNNGHFFSNQYDNNYAGELKYEFQPFDFLKVSTGGNIVVKDRKFTARRLTYRDQVSPFVTDMAIQPVDIVLSDENIANGTIELIETTQFGLTQSDWYNGYQTIYAGFISTDWNFIENLSINIGGRVEKSTQIIEVPLNLGGGYVEASRVENTDFLPAVNITYALTDQTNLRAAYSRTLARPEFREISNFNFANFMGGQRVYGNPDLKQTNITNYDIRLETYPGGGELFAVSIFYKHFENPIELFYRLTDANEVFYDNAPEADLYGIEIEGRKNITERLLLVANASYIFSESKMGKDAANRVANIKRPMVGQSPYIINVSAFYAIPEVNMDFSLSYNTFGERIVTVGKNGQQYDEYEQPFHNLRAKIDYSIGRVDLSLEADNLLNDVHEYKLGPATTYRYEPGMTFKLGVTLSL